MTTEPEKTPEHRVEKDPTTGEDRYLLNCVPRTQEDLRRVVKGIMDGSLFPSVGVPSDLISMVFMPLALGALRPSEVLIKEVMGSSAPPEVPGVEIPLPVHPGYKEKPSPPKKLKRHKLDPQLKSDFEWGKLEEDDWLLHVQEVENKNALLHEKERVREEEYQKTLLEWDLSCKEVDRTQEEALALHAEKVRLRVLEIEEVTLANQAWVLKYEALFKHWGDDIGVLLGEMKKAAPRSINGYPMFFGFEVLSKEDWIRAHKALVRETERQKELEV